jgi:chromate transporter
VYGQLSLLAFGGAPAVLPEMQRQVVGVHRWMTAQQSAALYALAQAAPGPNLTVFSLVGWRVAGIWGALVTTGAVAVPSSVLTLAVNGVWFRFKGITWCKALQAVLQPVTAGLIMASAALLIRSTAVDWTAAVVVAVASYLFLFTKLHPMLVLAGSAAAARSGLWGNHPFSTRTGRQIQCYDL